MKKNLRWKALLILAVVVGSTWAFYPPEEKIKLGLDLKGGIHLIMKVNTDDALVAVTREVADNLSEILDDDSIAFASINDVEPGKLVVEGLDTNGDAALRRAVDQSFPAWDVKSLAGGGFELEMRPADVRILQEETVTQAIQTIRRRVDALGVAEPVIAPHGDRGSQILVQLPGFEDVARAKEVIKSTAKLELRIVQGVGLTKEEAIGNRLQLPPGMEILLGEPDEGGNSLYYLLDRIPVITGRDLKNASSGVDPQTAQPDIGFTLKPEAARKFQNETRANLGRQLAIVLDGFVISAPTIQGVIYDRGQITGNFTAESAYDLALKLRSGALPASLEYQEERTVGPSLGADSIRSGITASALGFASVMLFILLYYRLAGVNAVVALMLNLLILVGALAYFAATLTLPGIAGVILTIGMGVDANVLIFERIKEEMRAGKTPRTAISAGFGKAFWTIVDANVTSLVAAAILFQFGTGPIQGFAVTLSIGLISNMFTAIFVSRFIFDLVLGGRRQVEAISI